MFSIQRNGVVQFAIKINSRVFCVKTDRRGMRQCRAKHFFSPVVRYGISGVLLPFVSAQ